MKSNNQIDDKINSFSLFVSFIILWKKVENYLHVGSKLAVLWYAVVLLRMIMKMLPTRNKFHYEALSLHIKLYSMNI